MSTSADKSRYRLLDSSRGLAGFYNASEREKQVLETLSKEIQAMRATDFNLEPISQPQKQTKTSLTSLETEVHTAYEKVSQSEFEGQHFTKAYRTLEGYCEKILKKLDNYIVSDEDEIEIKKKGQLIKRIQGIFSMLRGKVHANGNCCENCELYNTIWQ